MESLGVSTIDPVFCPIGVTESCYGTEGVDKSFPGKSAVFSLGKLKEAFVPIVVDEGRYVEEVARTGSPPQGEHLVSGEIIGMKHRPEVQSDAVVQPASVGKHFDRAFGTRRWIDSDEAVIKWWPFGAVGDEILLLECAAQCRDDLTRFLIIDLGKEIDVFRRPADKAVHDHGSAPGQRQRARLRQGQRGSRDSFLQRIQGHMARLPCPPSQSADATPTEPMAEGTSGSTGGPAQFR